MRFDTLNGQAGKWSEEQVREFRRAGDTNPKGRFLARLLVDGRPMTVELLLDFEEGSVSYRTTNPGSGGIVAGWTPPATVVQFLTPEFLRLFIFDGEFAERLFNPEEAEADRAIDALCQIYLLDEISAYARAEWDRKVRQAGAPKSEAALKRAKEDRATLLHRKQVVEAARNAAEQKAAAAGAAIADLERKISERVNSVDATRVRNAEAQVELARADAAVERTSTAVMQAIRMPLSLHGQFAKALIELKEKLDVLRLPENTSAQFFEDLMLEPECVCGRSMTEGAQNEIRTRAKRYLGTDESGTINAMKQDIGKFTGFDETPPPDALTALMDDLGAARRLCKSAEQTVRALKQKLIDEGDDQLKVWQDALQAEGRIRSKCADMILRIGSEEEEAPIDEMLSLKALDRALKEADRRMSEITMTVTLRRQTEMLESILRRAGDLSRSRIKNELIDDANVKLQTVLVNDPLRIERIERSLRLANQRAASVGQTLAVGYTFLMSILKRGNNEFPLIVDSPANSIDETVRRNIGKLIPELCGQFVAFTINTERAGFVSALASTGVGIKYLTLFRKNEGTERLMVGLPSTGVTRTLNAVLVEDRAYFMGFDVGQEQEA